MKRSGLSLLEVLVALAIFLFSLVALSQLIGVGGDIAIEMDWRSQSALRAESKLAEVLAGIEPLESQSGVSFDDDPNWSYSIEAVADDIPNLYRVSVTVSRPRRDGSRVEVTLSQFVIDPAVVGSAAATEP